MLSLRGQISDILTDDGVAHMRAINAGLESVTVENIGHAPMLDEPDAWDAVLDFLARVE